MDEFPHKKFPMIADDGRQTIDHDSVQSSMVYCPIWLKFLRANNVSPAAAETFNDSTFLLLGIRAFKLAAFSISGEHPSFSLPKTMSRRSLIDAISSTVLSASADVTSKG